jgi:hypothetical protein
MHFLPGKLIAAFRRTPAAAALVLLLATGVPCSAEQSPEGSAIAADSKRVEAMIRHDVEKLSGLLSEKLVYGHSDGRVQTKEQLLSAIASNRMQYRSFNYTKREEIELGAARGVHGTAVVQVVANNTPLEFTIRFLAVYVREGEEWKLSAYQSTQVLPPRTATRGEESAPVPAASAGATSPTQ